MIDECKKIISRNSPFHLAIIMDGNRRWARRNNFPLLYGHKKGVEAVKKTVETCKKIGVKYLTLYTFSTENWKRSKTEISGLFMLLERTIKEYKNELKFNNISLKISGRYEEFPKKLVYEINETIEYLKGGEEMVLNLALNYGGRREIVDAVNKALNNGAKKITEDDIERNLYTYPLPPPHLIIRTSGEMRLSNFLIWQSAYSEFYVTDTLWPDFSENEIIDAIIDFSKRERRLGR
ncbi:MAG: polyprenyl diphosphate synthase [Elusimicrobiales bacterium]|nr:polyprenyl diphosphate synthase [Elusimicrobiales bacterium]